MNRHDDAAALARRGEIIIESFPVGTGHEKNNTPSLTVNVDRALRAAASMRIV